ncbi:MAG: membrane protein insertase YidC [Rikenellaceae bacterium]
MDKNKIIGLALISVLFFAFSYFNTKEQAEYNAKLAEYEALEAEKSAQEVVKAEELKSLTPIDVEEQTAQSVEQIGESLTSAKIARGETIKLENDVMNISFSTRGAQVQSVQLKDYTKYAPRDERSELVEMFDPKNSMMDLSFYVRSGLNNLKVNTVDYTFEALPVVKVENGQQLVMSLKFDSGAELQYVYTLYNTQDDARDYMLDFKIRLRDMTPIMANQSALNLRWEALSYQNERGFKNENTYTTIAYHFAGENSINELSISEETKSETVSTAVEWIGFKQQFFTSAIISPESQISTADLKYTTADPHSGNIKNFLAVMTLPIKPDSEEYNMALYFGPNKYSTLNAVNDLGYGELTMEEIVPLGWGIFGWVNRWFVIPVFDLLRDRIASFGIIILILTILIKIIIAPMTYSSYISMAKMRVIKPQVDEISERYPKQEDAAKKQKATMDLYSKAGINPMGGCIPMLIQMPIVIAMFRFFPASIELRGESFLWAHDLSSYDSVLTLPFEIPFYGDHVSLFALLMAVVLFFYSLMNYNQTSSSQPQMAGMKFMMVYMMPVMMLLWFNSYSSGLCYYYFLSNLFTIGQTILIRRFVDDEKIHQIMRATANKNKDKKKSKFQLRYEEALAQQQTQQEANSRKKK